MSSKQRNLETQISLMKLLDSDIKKQITKKIQYKGGSKCNKSKNSKKIHKT